MEEAPKIKLPTLETALQDLKELESKYEISTAKLQKLSTKVDKLKTQKQMLKASLDSQKRTTAHYMNLRIEIDSKIQNILISQNKAKLMESSNMKQIKQIEANTTENKLNLNVFDFQLNKNSGLKSRKEDLLLQKKSLEEMVTNNKINITKLLNTFKS